MTIVTIELFTVECNGCGNQFDDLYDLDVDAVDASEVYGWVEKDDGEHLCPECASVEATTSGLEQLDESTPTHMTEEES